MKSTSRVFHYRTIRAFDVIECRTLDRTDILTDKGILSYTLKDKADRSQKSMRSIKRQLRNLAKHSNPISPHRGFMEIPEYVKLIDHGTIRLGR